MNDDTKGLCVFVTIYIILIIMLALDRGMVLAAKIVGITIIGLWITWRIEKWVN